MKKLIYSLAVMALLSSCGGGNSDTFESAKTHKCNMEKYAKEVAEGKDSGAKLKEATEMFEATRSNCIDDEGMTDFDAKILEAKCD